MKTNDGIEKQLNYFFKIRNRVTGLYSLGKSKYLTWKALGKTWPSVRHLRQHLGYLQTAVGVVHPYANCEIVVYKVVEETVIPIEDFPMKKVQGEPYPQHSRPRWSTRRRKKVEDV